VLRIAVKDNIRAGVAAFAGCVRGNRHPEQSANIRRAAPG